MGPKPDGVNMQLVGESRGNKSGPSEAEDDGYDPHLHRNFPKPTTNFETLVHLLKGSLGTGILAMPEAFMNSGLINGTVSTLLIGVLLTYCLHLLVKCQYELCKRKRLPLLSYPDTMQMSLEIGPKCLRRFSRISNCTVDLFMISYQLGICCCYIVFVASNIKVLVDRIQVISLTMHMVFLLLPLIAINCVKNLKYLAPFSTLANIMTFVGIGIMMYFLLTDVPSTESLSMWGQIGTYPLFFGTTLFALESVGVIITLENNMKTPKSFGGWFGVFNIGMFSIVVLYVLVGILGYIRYGAAIKPSVTLNLPDSPLAESVKIIFAVAVFISYGLQCFVPVDIIWRTYMLRKLENSNRLLCWELGLRMGLVILTFLLAVAIPRLGLFISLIGALCLSALGISFPAIIEICVRYPNNYGRFKHILIKDILLFIFGVIGLIVGTYTSILGIVKSFQ